MHGDLRDIEYEQEAPETDEAQTEQQNEKKQGSGFFSIFKTWVIACGVPY